MTLWRALLLSAFSFTINVLPAQEYIVKVQHFGVEQGLSHRQVNDVFQDSRGFVWVGTPNGLNRFDGYSFRLFTKEKNGLAFNDIQQIFEDADGWLWLIGPHGKGNVCLFHPQRGEVHSFLEKFSGEKPFTEDNFAGQFTSGPDRSIWFSLQQPLALAKYLPSSGFQYFPVPEFKKLEVFYFSARQTIWAIADENTLVELDQSGKVLQSFDHDNPVRVRMTGLHEKTGFYYASEPKGSPTRPTEAFFMDEQGKRNPANLAFLSQDLPFMPHLLFQLGEDGLIVSQNHLLHPQRGTVAEWTYPLHDRMDGSWRAFFCDKEGKIWLGDDFGLYVLHVRKNRFASFFHKKNVARDEGNSCRGIVVTPEKVWTNFEKFGLQELDRQSKTTRLLQKNPSGWGHFGLTREADGTLDAGFAGSLYRVPATGGAGELLPAQDRYTWAFYKEKSGRQLLGTERGLYVFNLATRQTEAFTAYNEFGQLAEAHIVFIGADNGGNTWICANNGFYLLDPDKGVTARYWSGGAGISFLPVDNFHHFHQDADGFFWFATPAGLVKVPPIPNTDGPGWEGSRGRVFTRADGLSNDVIYAVYEDRHDNLWLPSDNGIIQFDKKTLRSRTFLPEDGITDPEFNRISHFQDEKGVLYFGSLNGITAFDPEDFFEKTDTTAHPFLEITSFRQFDGEINRLTDRTAELLRSSEITLRPNDRFFNLEFALLAYQDVHNILYGWKMEGLDEDWTYLSEPNLYIGRLPYGTHTLRIRGQAANGLWSKHELSLKVKVIRPFYLRTWFVLLLLALIGVAIWGYNRWRTWNLRQTERKLQAQVAKAIERIEQDKQTIEKQAEELRHLDEVKSRFFANVSHELRTPLTLMLGPIGRVLKSATLNPQNTELLTVALHNGKHLLELINKILNLSKLQASNVGLNEAPVAFFPLVRRCIALFEGQARRQGVHFSLQYKAGQSLNLELDAEKVQTILSNLLSNAIQNTSAGGKVSVVAEDLGSVMRLTVSDTGRGIHPADLPHIFDRFYQTKQPGAPIEGGTGIGLALSMEFTKLMQGSLRAESELGKGSHFYFEVPKKEAFGFIPPDAAKAGEVRQPDVSMIFETAAADETPLILATQTPETPSANGSLQSAKTSRPTILVVEDSEELLQYIRLLLSEKYEVVTAENGKIALERLTVDGRRPTVDGGWWTTDSGRILEQSDEKLSDRPPSTVGRLPSTVHRLPDLILSDIMMPVMDGYQLLETLKSSDEYRHIPVIMLTARADASDKLKALRIGVDDYMVKPFDEEELLARVGALLHNYQERVAIDDLEFAIDDSENAEEGEIANRTPQIGNRVTAEEQVWLQDLENLIKTKLSDFNLTADTVAYGLAMSRAQFFRQIKRLTGLTPAQYLDEARFQRARLLLETGKVTSVKAAAYSVGLRQVKHFSQVFKQRFGKLPSDYLA